MNKLQHIVFVFALNILFNAYCFSQTKRIVVDINGKGDYKSVQGAINSLADSSANPRVIFVKKGIYKEKIYIQKNNIERGGRSEAWNRNGLQII